MSFLAPKSSTPAYAPPAAPTPIPPPPDRSDSQIQSAAASQRSKYYGSQGGRAMTELTGGEGADSPSAVVRLLGNVGRK